MRPVAMVLVALALVGACGDDDDSDEGAASTTAATAGETTTTITTAAAPVASAGPVLKPDGIDDLQFGASVAEVVSGLQERLGAPPEEENTAAECESSSDHTVFWPSLLLVFADNEWRGYSWNGSDSGATEKGIRVGSTVTELKAAYPTVEIAEGTIGWEWSVDAGGDLFQTGGLTGPEADATVDRVSAGDICAFR